MIEREQEHDERRPNTPLQPAVAGDGGGLDRVAQEGLGLAAAGHAIIDAALSGDSQAFLLATRQAGGQ